MDEPTNIVKPDPAPQETPPTVASVRPVVKVRSIWEELAIDLDSGVEKFSAKHGIDQNLVAAVAIVEAQNPSNSNRLVLEEQSGVPTFVYERSFQKFFASLWKRKLQMILSATVLLVSAIGVGAIVSRVINPERQIVVQRKDGLPAYHKIGTGETEVNALEVFHSTHNAVNFVGRYTLAPVPFGTVLSERSLLTLELTERMAGRIIIPIPLKPDRSPSSLRENAAISLAFVKDGKSKLLTDVILLGVEKHDATLTLVTALTPAQFNEIQSYMVGAEVFVINVAS